ncbi:hypothetical protein LTR27_005961 [Elasticomyces elasticus]|nr:hypothetical protein LTR27_005961 [Elasticomyces elasticus]
MSTDAGQSLSSLDGLSSILAKMCEAQVTLTHSINELVIAQKTTNELIGTLIKDRTAGCGEGITAETRIEDTSNGDGKEQNTGDLRRMTSDVVLNPVAQVIGTFELLEQILLDDRVSMQTVLLAQRVNTAFLATITNSQALQRKLFFSPQSVTSPHHDRPTLNHLLIQKSVLHHLPLWLRRNSESVFESRSQLAGEQHLVLHNLKVCEMATADTSKAKLSGGRLHYVCADLSTPLYGDPTGIIERGSWQRMYLTQPPCALVIRAECSYTKDYGLLHGENKLYRLHGWSIIKEPGPLSNLLRSVKRLDHRLQELENLKRMLEGMKLPLASDE